MQSPKCGNLNEPLHKQGALELMTAMLGRAEATRGLSWPVLTRRRQIAVVGSSEADDRLAAAAEEVGRGLAEANAMVVCGGRGGVMEAAARGARLAGGDVIGILPGEDPDSGNPHLTHVVATGIGQARNLAVVASADAVIAIGGQVGNAGRDRVRSWARAGE